MNADAGEAQSAAKASAGKRRVLRKAIARAACGAVLEGNRSVRVGGEALYMRAGCS